MLPSYIYLLRLSYAVRFDGDALPPDTSGQFPESGQAMFLKPLQHKSFGGLNISKAENRSYQAVKQQNAVRRDARRIPADCRLIVRPDDVTGKNILLKRQSVPTPAEYFSFQKKPFHR